MTDAYDPPGDGRHVYLVLSRGQWDASASKADVDAAITAFYAWDEQHLAAGTMRPGRRLAAEGRRVSRDGITDGITDGPFAEAKEIVGGWWFVVAASLDEAAAISAHNPCAAYGLSYEVRPLEYERASAHAQTNETPPAWQAGQR